MLISIKKYQFIIDLLKSPTYYHFIGYTNHIVKISK